MWHSISLLLLIGELLLLIGFVIGRMVKKRVQETVWFPIAVFAINLASHAVPFFYDVLVLEQPRHYILGLLNCFGAALQVFFGQFNAESASAFAEAVPLFAVVYPLGVGMAVLATVSTAIELFSRTVRNRFRLSKALRNASCDIVVGHSEDALTYAKNAAAVVLLDDSVSRESATALMDDGYVIWRKAFTKALFQSHRLRATTRYHIICFGGEQALSSLDTFIAYKQTQTDAKSIRLHVEVNEEQAETVRREIIEKSGFEAWIDIFCTNELLARTFTEEHPITQYLPSAWIDNAAIRPNVAIHVFLLGFGKRGRELYRQSVLNNQLVTWEGDSYVSLPIHYHLCDHGIDTDLWEIDGVKDALTELTAADGFPLPSLPCETEVIDKVPSSREVLSRIKKAVQSKDSFSVILIDTDDDCRNIEIGAKLKFLLMGSDNFHLFIHSEFSFTEDEALLSYFGKRDHLFTHEVIVNDSLSVMARKLHEIYTAQYADSERARPDFAEYIRKKAAEEWERMDYFTMYSNIYAAMNLRLKLHLLGLTYQKDGKGEQLSLLRERYPQGDTPAYDAYFTPSVRNAMIAQEHARWNAYHLLGEYLPLPKRGISVKSREGNTVRFLIKNTAAKQHACLTTYQGLHELSSYLAAQAGGTHTAADYDYYIYDEMLLTSAEEWLRELGYSVTERE